MQKKKKTQIKFFFVFFQLNYLYCYQHGVDEKWKYEHIFIFYCELFFVPKRLNFQTLDGRWSAIHWSLRKKANSFYSDELIIYMYIL